MKKRTFSIFLIFSIIFSLFTTAYAKQRSVLFIKNGDMQSTYGYGILNRVYYSNSMDEYQIRIFDFDKKEYITLSAERRVYFDGSPTLEKELYNSFIEKYGNTTGTEVIKYRTMHSDNNVCWSIDSLSPTEVFENVIFNETENRLGNFRINRKIKIIDTTGGSDLNVASSETVSLIDNISYTAELYNCSYLVIRSGSLDTQTLFSEYKYGLLTKVFESAGDTAVRIYNLDKNNYTKFYVHSASLKEELYNSFFDKNGNQIGIPFVKYQTLLNDDVCCSVEYVSSADSFENAEYFRKSNTMGNLQLKKNTVIIDMTSENTISNSNLLIDSNLYTGELYNDNYLIIKSGELKERILPSEYRYGILTNIRYSSGYDSPVLLIYDFFGNKSHTLLPGIGVGFYMNGTYFSALELYNSFFDENGNKEDKVVRYRTILNNDNMVYSLDYITSSSSFENALFCDNDNTIGDVKLDSDTIIVGAEQSASEVALLTTASSSESNFHIGSLIDNNSYTGELYSVEDSIYDLSCYFYNDFYNSNTYTVNVTLTNNSSEYKNGVVYAAIYNKAGKVKGVAKQNFQLDSYLDTPKELTIENYSFENDDYVKIFTWDNNMVPLCNLLTYNIVN